MRRAVRSGRGSGPRWLLIGLSFFVGARSISPTVTIDALRHFDGSTDHIVIAQIRLPRTLLGIAVGAALAVAGCLMQGLTRNRLAPPEVLGIGAGAAFAVVLAIYLGGIESPYGWTSAPWTRRGSGSQPPRRVPPCWSV